MSSTRLPRFTRTLRAAARALPLLIVGALACDLPTAAPVVEQLWALPVSSTSLGVDHFLPTGVSIQGGTFAISLPTASFAQSLAQMCGWCPPGQFTASKPAFQAQLDAIVAMPPNVVSASVASGSVLLEVYNGLGFDPLRPSQSGPRGRLVSTITSGSVVLAADTIGGDAIPLTPGTMLVRVIHIAPSLVTGTLTVRMLLDSPVGDSTTFDVTQRLSARATLKDWRISDARIGLTNRVVSATDIDLDLGGVDGSVIDRVSGGTLVVTVVNPFNASGQFIADISAPGMTTISRPVSLAALATTSQRLSFSSAELHSILGRSDVRLSFHGRVTGGDPGSTLVVTPTQAVTITGMLQLTLRSEAN